MLKLFTSASPAVVFFEQAHAQATAAAGNQARDDDTRELPPYVSSRWNQDRNTAANSAAIIISLLQFHDAAEGCVRAVRSTATDVEVKSLSTLILTTHLCSSKHFIRRTDLGLQQ